MHEIIIGKLETDANGVVVTVSMDGERHTIAMTGAAISNRMVLYGLMTEREAIEAILREHATRLRGLPPVAPEPVEPLEQWIGQELDDLAEVEKVKAAMTAEVFERLLGEEYNRLKSLIETQTASHGEQVRDADRAAIAGGLRRDVTVRQGTEADLPPERPPSPTSKARLLAAVEGANSIAQLRQAIIEFAKD